MGIEEKMKKSYVYLIILFLTALAARIWWINSVPSEPVFDFSAYYEIACNIYNGQGHTYMGKPIAFQGMGYPYMLAFFFTLFGRSDIYFAKLINIPFSMATLVMCYFIFKKLLKKEGLVLAACAITALLPNYIAYNNVIGNEVIFTFLFTVLVWLQLVEMKPVPRWLLMGLVSGIAALVKPYFIAFPVVMAFTDWMIKKDMRGSVKLLAVTGCITALMISPWAVRNYKVFGRLIPVSYNSGYVFFVNNNPNNTTGLWMELESALEGSDIKDEALAVLSEKNVKLAHELDPLLSGAARKWAFSNPVEYFKLGFMRLNEIFFSGAWDINNWAMNGLTAVTPEEIRFKNTMEAMFDIIIYVLCSFGLVYTLTYLPRILRNLFNKKKLPGTVVAVVDIGFFVMVYFFFEGQARYNFPLLFLFAGFFCQLTCVFAAFTSDSK